MTTCTVDVKFTFIGKVVVRTQDPAEAKKVVQDSFGLVIGQLHASDERVVDWEFDTHPEKTIVGTDPKGL